MNTERMQEIRQKVEAVRKDTSRCGDVNIFILSGAILLLMEAMEESSLK